MSHGRRGFRFDGRSFSGVVSAAAVSTRTNTPVCNAPGLFGDAYGGEAFSYIVFSFACALRPSEPSHGQRPATR